jgi:hypothetical protein
MWVIARFLFLLVDSEIGGETVPGRKLFRVGKEDGKEDSGSVTNFVNKVVVLRPLGSI